MSRYSDVKHRKWQRGHYLSPSSLSNLVGSYATSLTETDYSLLSGEHGHIAASGEMSWPDGSNGHIDGIKYTSGGDWVYYTASHEDTGNIYVFSPDEELFRVIEPDIFVDSAAAGGGDGSLSTPYNTIGDIPSLSGGEIIAIASDSVLSDSTLTLAAGCEVYRYGPGARPIIDCGVTFTPGSWSATGGTTNVYQQTVSIYLHPSTSWVNILEDGSHMTYVANTATCDSTAGSYTVSAYTGTEGDNSVTVYIHPTGSTDPTSNGSTYRYSRHYMGVEAQGIDSITVDGIHSRLQTANDGSIVVGANSVLRHCTVEYGGKHNMLAQEGSLFLGVFAKDQYYNSGASHLVCHDSTATGLDMKFYEVAATRPNNDYDANSGGIFAHAGSGSHGDVYVRRCYFSNIRDSSTVASSGSITISNSVFLDCGRISSPSCSITVNGVSFRQATSITDQLIVPVSGATFATLSNMYIRCNNRTGGNFFSSVSGITVTISDCQILPVVAGHCFASISAVNAVVSITGCQFGGTGVWNRRMAIYGSGASLTSDNNAFVDEASNFAQFGGTTYATLALWQAQGFDLNSTLGSADVSKVPAAP